jgi:hypothetical protein
MVEAQPVPFANSDPLSPAALLSRSASDLWTRDGSRGAQDQGSIGD